MNIVPVSHTTLVRARREMEKLFYANDWDAVRDWDRLLAAKLNEAFDDPSRDHKLLVAELEKILSFYSQMVRSLPDATAEAWLRPESVR